MKKPIEQDQFVIFDKEVDAEEVDSSNHVTEIKDEKINIKLEI